MKAVMNFVGSHFASLRKDQAREHFV